MYPCFRYVERLDVLLSKKLDIITALRKEMPRPKTGQATQNGMQNDEIEQTILSCM